MVEYWNCSLVPQQRLKGWVWGTGFLSSELIWPYGRAAGNERHDRMVPQKSFRGWDPLISQKVMGRAPSVLRREGRWLGNRRLLWLPLWEGEQRPSSVIRYLLLPTSSTCHTHSQEQWSYRAEGARWTCIITASTRAAHTPPGMGWGCKASNPCFQGAQVTRTYIFTGET